MEARMTTSSNYCHVPCGARNHFHLHTALLPYPAILGNDCIQGPSLYLVALRNEMIYMFCDLESN